MNTSEYYILYSNPSPLSPTIELGGEYFTKDDLLKETPIETNKFIDFIFSEPYKKKFIMTDFLEDALLGVISEKVHTSLSNLNIQNFEMLPATILDPKSNTTYNYYFMHIYNRIECLDMENSVCSVARTGSIRMIKKMALNNALLNEIPLEDRLIFRLKEYRAYRLFHKSIVEAIMSTNPEGIRFVAVEDYSIGSAF